MTLARRHIDPTNADRRARIDRQHRMSKQVEPPAQDDISTMMKWAEIIVGALVFSIFLYAWIAGDQPVNFGGM